MPALLCRLGLMFCCTALANPQHIKGFIPEGPDKYAAASPLLGGELPAIEIELDNLSRFHKAFFVKPESDLEERVVSAAMATLITHAKH